MSKRPQSPDTAESEAVARFEAVVAEHEEGLLRYAARLLGDANAAQDVVQEAFSRLFRDRRGGKEPKGSAQAWLYRVTHNLAVDHIRHESRLRLLHSRHAEHRQSSVPATQQQETETRELTDLVWADLRRLKPREQQVVILRIDEGKSYKEISEITKLSESNVGFILHHALKKLAKSLKQKGVIR
ncbi:MAG: sigma-70 family RNA polymerase sigma factor [Kiritimatiellae bacterium]|nr:sigma-70 family RNA polymerase sigma factor [Kiritimatiellia bacterium]